MNSQFPSRLWIVRHGESAGNVARDLAMNSGSHTIDLAGRDMDVPLSDLGRRQSESLGRWFANLPAEEGPDTILSSPYRRARDTACIAAGQWADGNPSLIVDERLREKEFGALDRLTKVGIEALYPQEAKLRAAIGKFYYRPPAGESWCDVLLRLRGAFETLCLHYAGKRVLLVSHQVVVLCFRYLIEGLDEKTLLAIDSEADVANCAITEYRLEQDARDSKLILQRYNFTTPLQVEGTPVTAEPDRASSK